MYCAPIGRFLSSQNFHENVEKTLENLKDQIKLVNKSYENFESLLLKSLSNKSIADEIEYVKSLYKGDLNVDQLLGELQMLKAIVR